MDAVTLDPETDALKPEFVPNTTIGGPGDFLHPNRAGYAAMGEEAERALRVLFDDIDDQGDKDQVTLCHKGKTTIVVGAAAVPAHLKHGDTLGPCPE